ncbi:MAG: hypothetical protein Pars2KO_03240 [Parasphingorhabdus sp.]
MNVGTIHQGAKSAALFLWVMRFLAALVALLMLITLSQPANAQTVNQYTINEPGGSNDIVAARTCGTGGSPLVKNFVVGTNFIVSDVDLGFLASHSYRTDINVILQSPAGTRVTAIVGSTAGGNTNLNVRLSDEFSPAVNSGTHGNDNLTPTPTPYQRQFSPNNSLTAFDGENSIGTWRMEICDMFPGADDGNFLRADLWLTELPTNYADLSLSKNVSTASPAFGATITYTLQVTNAASSPQTATGVVVNDLLPTGTSFVSASGDGTYVSGTGDWSLPSIAPGQTRTLTITATVAASSGATVVNSAEITASSQPDLDSTVNNGSTSEDDDDTASFTVSGTRVAGTPPNLGTICSPANQITFDWNAQTWTTGSTNNSYSVTGIGSINYTLTTDTAFVTGSPTINSTNTGGFGAGAQSLFINLNNGALADEATTVLTLPTAVPGLQFRIFDIDFLAGQFADKITVTGTYNGTTVNPTLTNGIANYVVGNIAIGDGPSSGDQTNGNVVVTFTSPVDTVTIEYGNHSTAPNPPGNQFMNIYDMVFCTPATTLSVTKISQVISDPVNGTTNPKAIPGAIMQYCILISNAGSASAESITATDTIPGNVTYNPASMQSGSNCGSASTAEDDDATGADESDPFGASISGADLVATAASLGPAEAYALTFQVTVD